MQLLVVLLITFGLPILVFADPIACENGKWPKLRFIVSVILVWCTLIGFQQYITSPADFVGNQVRRKLGKTGIEKAPTVVFGWVPGVIGAATGLALVQTIQRRRKRYPRRGMEAD